MGRRVGVLEGGFRGWERQRLPAGSLSLCGWKDVMLQVICARGVSQHVAARRLQVVYEQAMDAIGQVRCTRVVQSVLRPHASANTG